MKVLPRLAKRLTTNNVPLSPPSSLSNSAGNSTPLPLPSNDFREETKENELFEVCDLFIWRGLFCDFKNPFRQLGIDGSLAVVCTSSHLKASHQSWKNCEPKIYNLTRIQPLKEHWQLQQLVRQPMRLRPANLCGTIRPPSMGTRYRDSPSSGWRGESFSRYL